MARPLERINLDWVRGLAALAVVLLHSREIGWIGLREFARTQQTQGPWDIALAWLCAPSVWGSAGVAVFFVLSGYVIHAAAATKMRADPRWRLNIEEFYLRRFVRIYSVLIVAIVLTQILDSISATLAPSDVHLGDRSLVTLAGNLLALQGTAVHSFGSNGPLWTLAIEIHFYAVYPLLLIARRRWSPSTILLGSAVLSISSWWLLRSSGIELFTSYYVCWMLGFYAAELRAEGRLTGHQRYGLPTVVFCALGCVVFFVSQYLALLLWSISFYLWLLGRIARPSRSRPLTRGLGYLGAISYTLYAIHEPIAVFVVVTLNAGTKSHSMVFVFAIVLIAVSMATGLYFLVEKRAIAWLEARNGSPLRTRPVALDAIGGASS